MAEAMALGKPVIATAYSGNLDFMDEASSYLVGWERTAVPPGALYAGGTWAEPDLAHAAELMREVHGAPDAAAERGLLATHRIAATLAPGVVGARVHARVGELAARLPDPPPPSDPLVATLLGVLARQRTDGEAATYALAGAEAAQRQAADAAVRVHRLAAGGGFGHRPHPVAGVVQTYRGNGEGGPYVALEHAFRGDAETIRARQRWYLPLLDGAAPVLDAGCGRGEMLDLLTEAGIAARGVDADAGMAAACRARGLDVTHGDALEAIGGTTPGELGAIFCAHVVEHLDGAQIERLLLGAHAALRPGGVLVLETPNAYFPLWLRLFWIDPTHRRPVPPEALLAMLAGAGFADAFHTHPNGSGHVEVDRFNQPDCAVIATKGPA
jgi:SAM-dependent methyltransferase